MAARQYPIITDLLSEKRLVQSALPSIAAVAEKLSAKDGKQAVSMVYGETYDAYGVTLDSLKYYFFVALLQESAQGMGMTVEASVITGDLHSVQNKIVKDKASLLSSADSRLEFIRTVTKTYGLDLQPLLMSKLFDDPGFKQRLDVITPLFQQSEELQAIAKKTVLVNRLAQEEKVGFQYTLDEVALITPFDIKVGPPREAHYDKLARQLGPSVGNDDFCGVYLTPTYPLGLGFDYFVTHPEIEQFGLTPYKAGSNQLQANRIILGVTSPEECQKLIDSSFVAANPILPNPVLDLYVITQMAGHFLNGEVFAIDDALVHDATALKAATYDALINNIYKPLGLLP